MNSATKTLLRARWIAPMDRPVIAEGAVVITGKTIVEVGDASELRRAHPDADEHELGQTVVLPGLINAHVHLELSDLTPPTAVKWDRPLADWLIEVINRSPQPDNAARVTRAVDIGVAQCLRFGVTTVGDVSRQHTLTRPLLRNSPLRVVSFGEIQAMAGRRHLLDERLATATNRTHETDRLRVGLSPHAPYSVEPDGYRRCVQLAIGDGFSLATHLAESADEATFLSDHTGPFRRVWDFLQAWDDQVPRCEGGPIRLAKSVGLLDVPAVLAHVNYCDAGELQLLAQGKPSVVYCPRTHAYFGHPHHPWRDMLAAGVNVAVGTDSLASSPDLNLVDDLRLVRQIVSDMEAEELWQLITSRAARALQMDAMVGSLAPGKAADFACFQIGAAADPLEAILRESVSPSEVWIAGQRVFPAPPQSPTL